MLRKDGDITLLSTLLIILLSMALTPQARAQTWIRLEPIDGPPDARSEHTAVYRNTTNRIVVFGGTAILDVGEKLLNDLWILEDADGSTGIPSWTQIATENGPSARSSHTAVYDTNTNRMIVFGGSVGVGSTGSPLLSNEVWVLENADATDEDNPPKWSKLSPAGGPSGRAEHTAVYDPSSNRMMVFGGNVSVGSTTSSQLTNEVWVLENANGADSDNLPTWIQLTPDEGPSGREAHTAVYDPTTNRMIAFGGNAIIGTDDFTTLTREVWVLENANGIDESASARWIRLVPSGDPGARDQHTTIYDFASNRMTIFGGNREVASTDDSTLSNDVWILENANGLDSDGQPTIAAWSALSTTDGPPSTRDSHTTVYNNNLAGNRMVLFAGQTGCALSCVDLNDVWVLTDANGIIPPGEPVFGATTTTEEENQSAVTTSSVDVTQAPTPGATDTEEIGPESILSGRTGIGGGGTTVSRGASKPPVIRILGPNPITIMIGSTYSDQGATASDSLGGDLTERILVTSNVNTKEIGSYVVVFKVTDSNGDTSTATRKVNVVRASIPETTLVSAADDRGRSLRSGARTTSRSIIFSFTGTDKTALDGFECSLDASAFSSCSSPKKYTKLALGSRSFKVRAINKLGKKDPSPAQLVWTVLAPSETSPLTQEFVLLGTFIAGSQRQAIVLGSDGELKRLELGEVVDGLELAEIHKQRAVFKDNDSTLELILDFTRR